MGKLLNKKELLKKIEKFIEEGHVFFFASDANLMYYGPESTPVKQALLGSIIHGYSKATELDEKDVKRVIEMSQKTEEEKEEIIKEELQEMVDKVISQIFGGGKSRLICQF